MGKHHGPGEGGVGGAAPEFAIDKVGEAAKAEAEGQGGDDTVGEIERVNAVAAGEPEHGQHYAEDAAVEAHAAFPDAEGVGGIGDQQVKTVGGQGVEQHEAEASAQNNPENDGGEGVVQGIRRDALGGECGGEAFGYPQPTQHTCHVGEAVPADSQRAEVEGDGIDFGEGEHGGRIEGHRQ